MRITPADEALLSLLREDARASTADIARQLGLSRTTVQNRIARLEASIGAALFLKTPGGYQLTAEGSRLMAPAEAAERAATAADFSWVQDLGIAGFPTLLAERNGQLALLTNGYQPLEVLQPLLARWLERAAHA